MAAPALVITPTTPPAAIRAAAAVEAKPYTAAQREACVSKLAELLASVDLDQEQAERGEVNALIDDVLDRCRDAALALEGRQSLWQLDQHLGVLLDAAEIVEDGRAREVIESLIAEYLDAHADKVDGWAEYIAHCEERAEGAKREKARLAARQAQYERRTENLKARLNTYMGGHGLAKLEGEHVTFSRRRCAASVEIVDPEAVPDGYCKITVEPSKTLLKPALKAGESIPGAVLVTDKYTVVRS